MQVGSEGGLWQWRQWYSGGVGLGEGWRIARASGEREGFNLRRLDGGEAGGGEEEGERARLRVMGLELEAPEGGVGIGAGVEVKGVSVGVCC